MPRVRRAESWELALRVGVRSSTTRGWTLREQDGYARLEVRAADSPRQTTALPFRWSQQEVGPILARVRNIYMLTLAGHGLDDAASIAEGRGPQRQDGWTEALQHFRQQKLDHGGAIRPITWAKNYAPVLELAVQLLEGPKSPPDSASLLDACLRGWAPGSRARQIRAQSLAQFLRHCVEREKFPDSWRPPLDLRPHIGVPAAETAAGHRKGDPFSDLQVLQLLDSLPKDQPGRRWADALRLLAELGLRPIELQHLGVRSDPGSGQPLWWCTYRKRSGGGMTTPRWVHPLPLTDWDGRRQDWRLLERWRAGAIELPPLGNGPGAADAIGTYLKRQQGWVELRENMAEKGERAVPYSFRHGYSLRGHQLGVDAGSMARSMGHSLEVHLRSYPWASGSSTAAAFARALGDQ
ncbi:site-specific integrase [Synechococcus sp. BA-132 BA5]|uniref:site-specific integrase n=1 Tax=Synechococcus sp. BA-132 BA5 TaxID=3110252 RepID=UPI002B1ED3A1|nr:site-specific integrase [Synechococcus sp. BA-132 BA5]MEA5414389.1 site-specific integrase [Synechococcus sp. BA-132 BA5]